MCQVVVVLLTATAVKECVSFFWQFISEVFVFLNVFNVADWLMGTDYTVRARIVLCACRHTQTSFFYSTLALVGTEHPTNDLRIMGRSWCGAQRCRCILIASVAITKKLIETNSTRLSTFSILISVMKIPFVEIYCLENSTISLPPICARQPFMWTIFLVSATRTPLLLCCHCFQSFDDDDRWFIDQSIETKELSVAVFLSLSFEPKKRKNEWMRNK